MCPLRFSEIHVNVIITSHYSVMRSNLVFGSLAYVPWRWSWPLPIQKDVDLVTVELVQGVLQLTYTRRHDTDKMICGLHKVIRGGTSIDNG